MLRGGFGRGGVGPEGVVAGGEGALATHDKQKRGAVGSRCSIVLEEKSKREELLWAQTMTAALTSNMPSAPLLCVETSAGTTTTTGG